MSAAQPLVLSYILVIISLGRRFGKLYLQKFYGRLCLNVPGRRHSNVRAWRPVNTGFGSHLQFCGKHFTVLWKPPQNFEKIPHQSLPAKPAHQGKLVTQVRF